SLKSDLDVPKHPFPVRLFKSVESVPGATPDRARVVLQELIHGCCQGMIRRGGEHEHQIIGIQVSVARCLLIGVLVRLRSAKNDRCCSTFWIELVQPVEGTYPVISRTGLEQVSDVTPGQSLFCTIICEGITVITGQPIFRAKPEEAARIPDN